MGKVTTKANRMKAARITAHRFVMEEGCLTGEVSLMVPTKLQQHVARPGTRLMELSNMYVDPRRRGRGWGMLLMEMACNYADLNQLDLVLRVTPYGKKPGLSEEGLVAWYEGFGFTAFYELMVRQCANPPR